MRKQLPPTAIAMIASRPMAMCHGPMLATSWGAMGPFLVLLSPGMGSQPPNSSEKSLAVEVKVESRVDMDDVSITRLTIAVATTGREEATVAGSPD